MRLRSYYCMNCHQILYLDIHGAQRMHPGDFKDQPIFSLVPAAGEGCRLPSEISTGFTQNFLVWRRHSCLPEDASQ